jgi:hypothetical protein
VSGRSAFPALASATDVEARRLKLKAFVQLSTVSDVVSVLDVIPKEQDEKVALIRDLAAVVAPVRVAAAGDEDLLVKRLRDGLREYH